jgi:hypothetical protein
MSLFKLEYFDMKKTEMKLVKSYQILTQYLMYSIRHLNKKNAIITDLVDQQHKYNEVADDIIKKQVYTKFNIRNQKLNSLRWRTMILIIT